MALKKPSIKQLEYFVATADLVHFRKAAQYLNISQPTLTSQIAALEETLNQQLFERSRHGTKLSVQGKHLLPQARRVVEEMNAFTELAFFHEQGYNSSYHLGVSPTLGPYYLPHVIKPIHEQHKQLKLFVKEDTPDVLEEELLASKLDLVLTPLPIKSHELTVFPLFEESIKLVVPSDHPFAKNQSVKAERLADESILSIDEHHPMHHKVKQLCEQVGAQTLKDYQGNSLDALRQMVVLGMGISFLPALYIHSELNNREELSIVDIKNKKLSRTHALIWRRTSPSRHFYRQFAEDLKALSKILLGEQISIIE